MRNGNSFAAHWLLRHAVRTDTGGATLLHAAPLLCAVLCLAPLDQPSTTRTPPSRIQRMRAMSRLPVRPLLLPLLLAVAVAAAVCSSWSLLRPVSAACATATYNDGYVSIGDSNGGFTTATSGITFASASWSIEAWVRRAPGSGLSDRWFFSAGNSGDRSLHTRAHTGKGKRKETEGRAERGRGRGKWTVPIASR